MAHLETWRLPIFVGVLVFLGFAETFFPARAWQSSRSSRWICHFLLSLLNTVLTRLIITAPFFLWVRYVQNQSWGISQWLYFEGLAAVLLTVVVYDIYNYGWHRLNHRVSFLWKFHQVHHLDTHLDVTTSLRFHPMELALAYGAKSIWILLWGPSLEAFLITEMTITLFAQFHHANIDLGDTLEKYFRLIWISPRIHTGHHTSTRLTRDANYGTIFSFWDRLFLSLKDPSREDIKSLGLPYGRDTYLSFQEILKAPFLREE